MEDVIVALNQVIHSMMSLCYELNQLDGVYDAHDSCPLNCDADELMHELIDWRDELSEKLQNGR